MSPSKTFSLLCCIFFWTFPLDFSLVFPSFCLYYPSVPTCPCVPVEPLVYLCKVVLNSWPDYLHTPASHKSDSDSCCVPPESMTFINCMSWNCLIEGRHDVLGQGTEENRSLVPGFLLSWLGVSLSLLWVSLATPSQIESEDYSLSAGLSVTKQEPPVMSVWRDVQAALWFPEPVPWAMTFPRAPWFFPLSLCKDWKSGGCVCVELDIPHLLSWIGSREMIAHEGRLLWRKRQYSGPNNDTLSLSWKGKDVWLCSSRGRPGDSVDGRTWHEGSHLWCPL